MVAFIDAHRETYGVEPICEVPPIAPSTYFRHRGLAADPTRRSARARRDAELQVEIRRVWDEQHQVYGPRKVWRLAEAGIAPSVGSRGHSYDNASRRRRTRPRQSSRMIRPRATAGLPEPMGPWMLYGPEARPGGERHRVQTT